MRFTGFRIGRLVAWAFLLTLLLGGYLLVSFFHLDSEATALRCSVMNGTGGEWHQKIAFNAGWLSTSVARMIARFVPIPSEARAALGAVHGAEVGIYRQQGAHPPMSFGAVLELADRSMASRGWERVVGVVQARELVAVYLPRHGLTNRRVKCCLMVVQGEDLVIAGVRGNAEPLLALAANHPPRFGFAGRGHFASQ